MEPTTNKPVARTIHQMFQRMTVIMEATTSEQRHEFKKAWFDSLAGFNKRTDEIRYENWKRS